MVICKLSDGSIIFGLSAENVERLKEGKPIRVTQESHGVQFPQGLPMVGICYGTTEEEIVQGLKDAGET